uniref:C2 domain-containing protein n=1 Tax=Physcomitrium patens TaxID=3218 RepID=A0A7I4FW80_PHYPA
MPGTIRVSVLEAVELPKGLTDGEIGDNITAKVTLGPTLCKTPPLKIAGGEIQPWNSDFAFPVMNLRDKLGISICDGEDRSVSQTAIEIPSIIQKGSRDEFVELGEGGRIHLRMSFTLSDDERKKIETMRIAALKKKEEGLKKTVLFQAVPQPTAENTIKTPPFSAVAITEVQDSTTGEKDSKGTTPVTAPIISELDNTTASEGKDLKGTAPVSTMATTEVDLPTANGRKGTEYEVLGNGSNKDDEKGSEETGNGIAKPQTPKPIFNYAKAIGMQKSRSVRRSASIKRRVNPGGLENSTDGIMAVNGNVHPEVQIVGETGQGGGEVVSSEISTKISEASPEVQTANESAMDPQGVDLSAVPKSAGTNPEVEAVTESAKDTNPKDVGSSENTKLEDSVASPRTPLWAASSVTDSTEITPTATRPLSDQTSSAEPNALDAVKTRITRVSSKVARVTRVSSKVIRTTRVTSTVARVTRVAWLRNVLQKAVSNIKVSRNGVGIKQLGQGICSIIQDLKANLGKVKGLKFGQDQVLGERRKSALESKRSSPGEARRIVREERVGQVTSHSKEKSKILELIIEAASSHDEGFGDRRIIF